ncbi:MAG: molybdopterin dinucleotide binding domain-containing protein [Candidatus Methylomirabilales bacterium]
MEPMSGRRFILITGRTTKQGRTIHLGKEAQDYLEEISTLQMNPKDMEALAIKDGESVRLKTQYGQAVVKCKKGDLPEGLLFIAYGGFINALVGPDTQGTGMPDTKGIEVEVEKDGGHDR